MGKYRDNFLRELIVDNFAGGGGASVGIELAVGRPVDIAVNHDEDAIAMHRVNHPYTEHYQEDVFAVNPEAVTGGRPVGIAWFSPDCKHFSRAKGGKPVDKKVRGLSWVILKWAMSSVAPRCIFMENVEEIQTWGPIVEEDGKCRPDPKREGETFKGFIAMLTTGIGKAHPAFTEACEFLKLDPQGEKADVLARGLGYKVEYRTLKACDYSAPTIRKRFYLIARRDGQPIIFPAPTFGGKGQEPYRAAAECIDWSLPCPSIFGRKKDLAVNTQRRIARGLDKFVLKNPRPFIVPIGYGERKTQAPRVNDLNEPLSTIVSTCKQSLCVPSLMQYHTEQTKGEVRGQRVSEPILTVDGSPRYALAAANIIQYYGGSDQASKADAPLPTVTVKPRHFLVETHLCVLRRNTDCKAFDEPLPTITTSAGHFAQVVTYIQKVDTAQDLGRWNDVRKLLNKYAGYSIAPDEILILEVNGEKYFISDIGMRMLKAKELKLAQGFPEDYIIDIEPYIGKKYSEAKQIARLGNAVCPPVATALIRANCPEMAYRAPLNTVAELNRAINNF